MMTALVPVTAVTPDFDFTGIRFSRSKTGHVHSPWFTYNWRRYDPVSPYTPNSYFHWLREQSMDAFASALGLQKEDTICSQRQNPVDGQMEWRIGTIHPCELPTPRLTQAERMQKIQKLIGDAEGGVIDV